MEAARLMTLIGDIIRLIAAGRGRGNAARARRLLRELADEVTDSLRGEAAKRNIVLSVEGEKTEIGWACARLLYEIIYNLCDNAIKYNVEDGSGSTFRWRKARASDDCDRARIPASASRPRIRAAHLRAVLPRGQEPLQGLRRHGAGTVHRQARRAVSSWRDRAAQQRGKGTEIIVSFPL